MFGRKKAERNNATKGCGRCESEASTSAKNCGGRKTGNTKSCK